MNENHTLLFGVTGNPGSRTGQDAQGDFWREIQLDPPLFEAFTACTPIKCTSCNQGFLKGWIKLNKRGKQINPKCCKCIHIKSFQLTLKGVPA